MLIKGNNRSGEEITETAATHDRTAECATSFQTAIIVAFVGMPISVASSTMIAVVIVVGVASTVVTSAIVATAVVVVGSGTVSTSLVAISPSIALLGAAVALIAVHILIKLIYLVYNSDLYACRNFS